MCCDFILFYLIMRGQCVDDAGGLVPHSLRCLVSGRHLKLHSPIFVIFVVAAVVVAVVFAVVVAAVVDQLIKQGKFQS